MTKPVFYYGSDPPKDPERNLPLSGDDITQEAPLAAPVTLLRYGTTKETEERFVRESDAFGNQIGLYSFGMLYRFLRDNLAAYPLLAEEMGDERDLSVRVCHHGLAFAAEGLLRILSRTGLAVVQSFRRYPGECCLLYSVFAKDPVQAVMSEEEWQFLSFLAGRYGFSLFRAAEDGKITFGFRLRTVQTGQILFRSPDTKILLYFIQMAQRYF